MNQEYRRILATTCTCRHVTESRLVLPTEDGATIGGCGPGDLDIVALGLVPYASGLEAQTEAAARVRDGKRAGILLALRHPPVITLGHRSTPDELHLGPVALQSIGVKVYQVNRGGGATFHYPEQAVVYPILDLRRLHLTVPQLLQATGDAVLELLHGFGIDAIWDSDRPGAYVKDAKIASVGFHLTREITTHGVAINLGRDLRGFDYIDPCKVRSQVISSVESLAGECPDPDQVSMALARAIARRVGNRGACENHCS